MTVCSLKNRLRYQSNISPFISLNHSGTHSEIISNIYGIADPLNQVPKSPNTSTIAWRHVWSIKWRIITLTQIEIHESGRPTYSACGGSSVQQLSNMTLIQAAAYMQAAELNKALALELNKALQTYISEPYLVQTQIWIFKDRRWMLEFVGLSEDGIFYHRRWLWQNENNGINSEPNIPSARKRIEWMHEEA